MVSPICDRAVSDALTHGKTILKFISPNDVGLTGSHQYGFYLPKQVWKMFTPQPPTKGINHEHPVSVTWQDGRITSSVVHWYGKGTRSEYRITRFGKGFPFHDHDCVGSLLVLVIRSLNDYLGYVFDLEEDIEAVQAGIGVQVIGTWAAFDRDQGGFFVESEDECLDRHFRKFTTIAKEFPSTSAFSQEARKALEDCMKNFAASPSDERLMACVDAEYRLFRMVERKLCEPEIVRVFASVDDFIQTAQSILQRRKSRAGRSLENHVESVLKDAGLPYDARPVVEGTRPDILIPGKKQYLDTDYPASKLFAIGVKTTCKDRWRQVVSEAVRVKKKHIVTIQPGISPAQMKEMEGASVTLVVPKALHKDYPPKERDKLLSMDQFVEVVKQRLKP
jgi:EcoRII C terminal/Restriction endonuclease EcoRII, N-terminal